MESWISLRYSSSNWPNARLVSVLKKYEFSAVLYEGTIKTGSQIEQDSTETDFEQVFNSRSWRSGTQPGEHNLAYGCFTSGTTGIPHLALSSRHGLLNRLTWMQHELKNEPQVDNRVITLASTPVEYDSAIWQFLWPLSTGGNRLNS